MIHRGFLSPSSHPSHPLLLTSTDIRTPKATQLLANPLVEVCWWIGPSQEQFRLAARTTIVPAPNETLLGAAASKRLSDLAGSHFADGEVDWEKKRVEMFDGMSGHMKASWVRPVPGTKMPGSGGYDEAKNWPEKLPKLGKAENKEDEEHLKTALGNFALVVFDPYDVDYVELAVVPNQRTRFIREADSWKEEILVP
jgi:pyridoxamine 5'-phosphate oxidase